MGGSSLMISRKRDTVHESKNTAIPLPPTGGNTAHKVGSWKLNGFAHKGLIIMSSQNRRVLPPDVPRTFASLMSVRGMGAGFALVPQADVRFANVAELRESTQYVRLRALRKQRSCSHALRCSRAHYTALRFNHLNKRDILWQSGIRVLE